jgi:ribosome-associated translation inhibitor RaiA
MIIQFDTAHNVKANEEFKAPLIIILNEKLDRFSEQITRLEVHLSDENGNKEGVDDKRCLLEAHIEGMPHTVAKDHADSYKHALEGATDKLIASLNAIHSRSEKKHIHEGKPEL